MSETRIKASVYLPISEEGDKIFNDCIINRIDGISIEVLEREVRDCDEEIQYLLFVYVDGEIHEDQACEVIEKITKCCNKEYDYQIYEVEQQ